MTGLVGGILLPSSVLTSEWFELLATFVAFNTLVYVGLTVVKLVPWPRQWRPAAVRARLLGRSERDSAVS